MAKFVHFILQKSFLLSPGFNHTRPVGRGRGDVCFTRCLEAARAALGFGAGLVFADAATRRTQIQAVLL
jgi:hypothetical protein